MDCFHDFCLYCDRQSQSGPYCSPTCKIADFQIASSPSHVSAPSPSTSRPLPTRSSIKHNNGYTLPPAYEFPRRTPTYAAPTPQTNSLSRMSHFMWTPSPRNVPEPITRTLTPSSSRSSLSSNDSPSTSASARGQQDLDDYFSSFDQARAAKRRSSLR